MRPIFQPFLISTLLAVDCVNAVLLRLKYNQHEYLICSKNHRFTRDDQNNFPFSLTNPHPLRNPFSKYRLVQNTSTKSIYVWTGFPDQKQRTVLPAAGQGKFRFHCPTVPPDKTFIAGIQSDDRYIIVTPDEKAKVDFETWNKITGRVLFRNKNQDDSGILWNPIAVRFPRKRKNASSESDYPELVPCKKVAGQIKSYITHHNSSGNKPSNS